MTNKFQPIELGDRVKDPISGYQGIAHAITVYLNGCIRVSVQPEDLTKDGSVKEDRYFDQTQLVVLKKRVHAPVVLAVTDEPRPAETRRRPGGPARESSNYRLPASPGR